MAADPLGSGSAEHYEDAPLYDLEYAHRTVDIAWYRRQVRAHVDKGGRVLELGAGTGRITRPLARSGYHVVALDAMPTMLDALRESLSGDALADRIEVVHADLRELPLPKGSVPMVIAGFNTLMHLYTWQDLLACFREVRRVLAPGGHFAFDVHLPDLDFLTETPHRRHRVRRLEHPTTGESLVRSTNHRYDAATQVCHIKLYYDRAPPPGEKFKPPRRPLRLVRLTQRQIFPEELRILLDAAKLDIRSMTADFSARALQTGAVSQCIVAERRAR